MSQLATSKARPLARVVEVARLVLLSPLGIGVVTVATLIAADIRRFAEIDPGYGFLRWNLFLAWVPLGLAYAVSWAARREITRPALPLLALAWIAFLPNAPYLVTDLVHLREGYNTPNLIVLSLLALAGLLIGVKSVQLVQRAVDNIWGEAAGWRAVQVITVLLAFGVYLGRELRWNSWTIIQQPSELARVVLAVPAASPGRLALGLAGIVVFAVSFYVSYRVLTGARTRAPRLAQGGADR
jgi:uncharacterized membrane protein